LTSGKLNSGNRLGKRLRASERLLLGRFTTTESQKLVLYKQHRRRFSISSLSQIPLLEPVIHKANLNA